MVMSVKKYKGKKMTRGDVLEKVYRQIREDVYVEDFTAIEQLLATVSVDNLLDYLTEEDAKDVG